MIGVTAFGLIFTPVFYVVCRWIAVKTARQRPAPGAASGRIGAANRRGFSGLFRNIHLQFTGS